MTCPRDPLDCCAGRSWPFCRYPAETLAALIRETTVAPPRKTTTRAAA